MIFHDYIKKAMNQTNAISKQCHQGLQDGASIISALFVTIFLVGNSCKQVSIWVSSNWMV